MDKKLRRVVGPNRQIFGVAGGIGEFLGIDPTVIRVLFVLAAFFATAGFWVYLVCAFVIPESDGMIRTDYQVKNQPYGNNHGNGQYNGNNGNNSQDNGNHANNSKNGWN